MTFWEQTMSGLGVREIFQKMHLDTRGKQWATRLFIMTGRNNDNLNKKTRHLIYGLS